MLSEYEWLDTMSLEETIPCVHGWRHEIPPIYIEVTDSGDDCSYRYRLDVDGYGWSSRWQKLLSTDSVVLKSTIYVSQKAIWILLHPPVTDVRALHGNSPNGGPPRRSLGITTSR